MMNPVLRREAITTLRGWRSFAILTFYLAMMAIGAAVFFKAGLFSSYNFSFDPRSMVYLYVVLGAVQMGLVVLSVPALTAGSISGERERQTLDLLLVTKLSPLAIVWGKLLSSMAFVLLLIIATLPIFAVVFYFGSVSVAALLVLFIFTLTTAFMLGGISVFLSCIYKRTVVSIMLVYIIIGFLCFGTLLMVAFPMMTGQGYDIENSIWSIIIKLIPNPGVAFFSLMDQQLGSGIVRQLFYYDSGSIGEAAWWAMKNMWILHIIFQLVVGTGFLFLAARMIHPTREQKTKKLKKEKKAKKIKEESVSK